MRPRERASGADPHGAMTRASPFIPLQRSGQWRVATTRGRDAIAIAIAIGSLRVALPSRPRIGASGAHMDWTDHPFLDRHAAVGAGERVHVVRKVTKSTICMKWNDTIAVEVV